MHAGDAAASARTPTCWCSTATCRWCAPATLRAPAASRRATALALLTAELADPAGYGRIVRDAAAAVRASSRSSDASPAERAIREVNAGFYALSARRLAGWLKKIGNRNAQKEYYLTDLVALAVADGVPVRGGQGRRRLGSRPA